MTEDETPKIPEDDRKAFLKGLMRKPKNSKISRKALKISSRETKSLQLATYLADARMQAYSQM